MKRILFLLCTLCLLMPAAFSQDTVDDFLFKPLHPELLAQGNAFTAVAKGYHSLFTNPAGFGRKGANLTIVGVAPSLYFLPNEENIAAFSGAIASGDMLNLVNVAGQFMFDGVDEEGNKYRAPGFGLGATTGIGFVGSGLGIGIINFTDVYGVGENQLGFEAYFHTTTAVVGGLAFKFNTFGFPFYIGADVRPMIRTQIREIGFEEVLALAGDDSSNSKVPMLSGFGLGLDVGAIAELGAINFGVSLRDMFGTRFEYNQVEFDLSNNQVTGSETPVEDVNYIVPMSLQLGVAWEPDMGALGALIKPRLQAEYNQVFYADRNPSFWTGLHAGAELEFLLGIGALRMGLNQGYITMGMGAKLLFMEVHLAAFAREIGDNVGTRPNSGFGVEFALRF
jgi:hypothetical protein